MGECVYSIRVDKGLDHYLLCSKSGSYCKYQKYCQQIKGARNTDGYVNCPLLEKEDTNMAKTTSTKKSSSTPKVEKKTEVVVDTPVSEEKHSAYYNVLVATPNYYILDINGCPTKIFGVNNYKKGDIVEL